MRILNKRFTKVGHKLYITDGKNTVRYFDLKKFKLVKFVEIKKERKRK